MTAITNMYSIYDNVAGVFNKPFMEFNHETAIRAFRDSASQQPHINDYTLYHVGTFDDNNGKLTPMENPLKLLTGLDIKPTISSITPDMQVADLKHQA